MDDNTIKALFAMGCITTLEIAAMYMGMNGVALAAAVAVLAGLGGAAAIKLVERSKKDEPAEDAAS